MRKFTPVGVVVTVAEATITIHTEHYEGLNSDSAGGDGEVRADLRVTYKAELTRVGMVAMRREASSKTQVTDFGTREETEKEEEIGDWR